MFYCRHNTQVWFIWKTYQVELSVWVLLAGALVILGFFPSLWWSMKNLFERVDAAIRIEFPIVHHAILKLLNLFNLLHLFPDRSKQSLPVSYKIWMDEYFLVFRVSRFHKVVHVKLTDERREVVMFEVLWENFVCKLVGFVNGKADAIGAPVYGRVIRRILHKN